MRCLLLLCDGTQARFGGKDVWYSGKVTKVAGDTYDILYADGDSEQGVAGSLMKLLKGKIVVSLIEILIA
jgi:hypothetical protein